MEAPLNAIKGMLGTIEFMLGTTWNHTIKAAGECDGMSGQ